MRRLAASSSVFVALCVFASRGLALTQPKDDMCTQPTMKTDKWKARNEVAGMSLLLPPGFVMMAGSSQDRVYANGDHRSITVGEGAGVNLQHEYREITETGECETSISGRRVTITMYHWVVEDALLSASGDAGAHFGAVARYYATGGMREVYVMLISNAPSDLKYFRQLFWTVSFPGATEASAASPVANATQVAAAPAPAVCAAVPGLPAPEAVIDSSLVRSLLASSAPIPKGYELMALQFSGSGDLSAMSIAQSDLPEASQHELTSVIATNLKPHDAHAPSTFVLRIDSSDTGLRYAVLSNAGCAH